MKTDYKRRDFINTCIKAGITCCAFAYGSKLTGQEPISNQDTKPDPKKLEYCGYKCPDDCPLKKGTLENDVDQLKKAYDAFKFKEKHGVEFNPDVIFCYGCKAQDKPLGLSVKSCTVRSCAISKGYDCCIQCDNLEKCDKELWTSFPKLKETVIGMQKKYREA